jgi:hypothetical protein
MRVARPGEPQHGETPATAPGSSWLPAPLTAVLDAAGEAAGVAKGTFDFFFGSMAKGAAADPAAKDEVRAATEEIPNQDIIYEQLAHNLAYGKYDVDQLKAWGYGPPQVVIPLDPLTGMFVVAVVPDPKLDQAAMTKLHGGIAPRAVLAFRGSTDAVDWADDVSPEGIGAVHFAAHKVEIAKALVKYSSKGAPDVTGHSLGGALAQMAATVGPVNRIVTFQAPGIPADMAAKVPEDVQTTQHRAAGDIVPWAGEAHLPGETYIYNQSTWGIPHTDFLLDGLNAQRAADGVTAVPGLYDGSVFSGADYTMTGKSHLDEDKTDAIDAAGGKQPDLTWVSRDAPDLDRDGQTDWYEQAFEDGRAELSEGARWLFGETLGVADEMGIPATRGFGNLGNLGSGGATMTQSPLDMRLYVELWGEIEPRIGTVPDGVLCAEIDAAPFTDEAWAEKMKSQVLLATSDDDSYTPGGAPSYAPGPGDAQ